ncbi:MAG: ATP-binding protein [Deltaproteobacteria bacterium]|nr:ATP-binding protein [Deltaproteobacteria bacterium]
MGSICKRHLDITLPAGKSAFLWGPRKVGKTYWIREVFSKRQSVRLIDLLKTDVFAEHASRPALLRERFDGRVTVIDEVQKVPALLDEVHWLMENRGATFLLSGSSARKLRRGHANLLGGRAWRYELGPLSLTEVEGFDLERAVVTGMLPPHFLSPDAAADLRAYVADYLAEEIAAEAVTQNLPAFAEFLRVAAVTNAELLSYANVGRETGVSPKVVRGYFQILEDTLLGFRLHPWTRSKTRRMILTDKFYFFDVGVANHLARRRPAPGTPEYGKSFEHLVLQEIMGYRRSRQPDLDVTYWRTSTGQEVDFILGDMQAAIEVKAGARVHRGDLRGLLALEADAKVGRKIVVCLESERRTVQPGIEILPFTDFVQDLYAGRVV